MKILKNLALGIMVVGLSLMVGCKKKATESDLLKQKPQVTVFQLTFSPTVNKQSFSGVQGFTAGDMILLYAWTTKEGEDAWVQLPSVLQHVKSSTGWINVVFSFNEKNGKIFVEIDKNDGTQGSPWMENMVFEYRAVVLKTSMIQENPDVDYKNYEEVQARFNLDE